MVDVIEGAPDVRVEHPAVGQAAPEQIEQVLDGIVRAPAGSEAVAGGLEARFPARLQRGLDHVLADSFRNGRNSERPRLAVGLRDVDPADGTRPVGRVRLELLHQPHPLGGGFDHLAVHPRSAAPGVDLRDLAHALDVVRIAPQQELLEVPDLLPLLLLRRAEDPLPQIRHLAVGLGPADAGPGLVQARGSG